MQAPEIVEPRYEPEPRKGHGGRDRQHSGGARAKPAGDVAQQTQHFARGLVKGLTFLGEPQLAMVTAKQGHAELIFQRLDLAADRRLRDEELGRRLGEAQIAGGGLEALQKIERRQLADPLKHSFFSCKTC